MESLCLVLQEMEHILEHIRGNRLSDNSQPDEYDHRQLDAAADDAAAVEQFAEGDAADDEESAPKQHKRKLLQTMVFSATLTLPQHLRKRLKKGEAWHSSSVFPVHMCCSLCSFVLCKVLACCTCTPCTCMYGLDTTMQKGEAWHSSSLLSVHVWHRLCSFVLCVVLACCAMYALHMHIQVCHNNAER